MEEPLRTMFAVPEPSGRFSTAGNGQIHVLATEIAGRHNKILAAADPCGGLMVLPDHGMGLWAEVWLHL